MRATIDTLPSDTCACLVEIIELKWLLRGHGVHVHVERLQSDPEYARATLDAAAAMPNAALRCAAERLRLSLQAHLHADLQDSSQSRLPVQLPPVL